jgi:OOP family OmpA-OmpF porin
VPKKAIISREDKDATIRLEKIEKGKGIVVENIHFEINEAYLLKESLNILDRMIEALKRNKKIRLEVRGHTDITGTHAHNMKLSERRADAVREYMIKNGISPERLVAVGFGPDKPIGDNKTVEGRRKNRRTEFFILDK